MPSSGKSRLSGLEIFALKRAAPAPPRRRACRRAGRGSEGRVVEAGAHLAGVLEALGRSSARARRALADRVVSHEQRAEVRPRPLGRGETADHELLLEVTLQLEPVARAGGRAVRAVGPLRDQPFEALAAGLAEQLGAVLVAMPAVAHPAAELQRAAQ